ncbi:MAG: site-specific integrase [Nanoarchaeota archaeon]|nr:site-specific integrase [Nanoarchaeota archaeon]
MGNTEIAVLEGQNTTKHIQIVNKKEKQEIPIYFTEDELRRFFMSIPTDRTRDKVFFLTLLGTGKRVSEVLAVKKNDIDFQNRLLRICTLKKRKRVVKSIRLHSDVAYWLSIFTGGLLADGLVFAFSRQYADDLCKEYADKAGISYKRVSCHIFRHTFAVRWLEQGKPIHKLKRHLDHSHINTTMVYLQIIDHDYNQTVDSLDILSFLKQGVQ